MSKKQKEQTITIDDVEHKVSDLTEQQVALVNHVSDLDRKIQSSNFNLVQLNIGRNACMSLLTEAMKAEDVEEKAVEVA